MNCQYPLESKWSLCFVRWQHKPNRPCAFCKEVIVTSTCTSKNKSGNKTANCDCWNVWPQGSARKSIEHTLRLQTKQFMAAHKLLRLVTKRSRSNVCISMCNVWNCHKQRWLRTGLGYTRETRTEKTSVMFTLHYHGNCRDCWNFNSCKWAKCKCAHMQLLQTLENPIPMRETDSIDER